MPLEHIVCHSNNFFPCFNLLLTYFHLNGGGGSAVVDCLSSNCKDLFIDVISQKTVPSGRKELLGNVGNYFASCGFFLVRY